MSLEGNGAHDHRDQAQREADRAAFAQTALLFNGKRIETAEDAAGFLGQPYGRLMYTRLQGAGGPALHALRNPQAHRRHAPHPLA